MKKTLMILCVVAMTGCRHSSCDNSNAMTDTTLCVVKKKYIHVRYHPVVHLYSRSTVLELYDTSNKKEFLRVCNTMCNTKDINVGDTIYKISYSQSRKMKLERKDYNYGKTEKK